MINVPPLRDRKDDIPLLVDHFLQKYSHETTKRVDRIKKEVLAHLRSYDWPGNVRELENAIERAVVLSKGRTLGAEDFAFLSSTPVSAARGGTLREAQKNYVLQVLEECDWNVTNASRVLDINRATLHKMIKRLNLKRP
jgi:two-component system response regulator HydG